MMTTLNMDIEKALAALVAVVALVEVEITIEKSRAAAALDEP
jgi:hypothetical protein